MSLVVVLAGGPDLPVGFEVPDGAMVIAADSGAELGVHVDLAVGDFDSISAHTLEAIDNVEPYPPEKDATDLELALDAALRESPTRILVVGSAGGRLDHLVSSLLLFGAEKYAAVVIDALLGDAHVHVVRGTRELDGEVGELISLFALHDRAEGVTTSGLVYPLNDEALEPGSSRGTSNAFHEPHVRITVARGVVLAVRPGV
jgi:thiamine pyrophosphokinase